MSGHTLSDAVVAVIGASGALGSIISQEFAERGAKVILVGRSEAELQAVGLTDAIMVLADLTDANAGDATAEAPTADKPMAGMVAYFATKAALTAADHAMGRELRKSGVDVYDIRPPHTETGLVTRALAGEAPKLPQGLAPEVTARRVVDAIEAGQFDVPAEDFSA